MLGSEVDAQPEEVSSEEVVADEEEGRVTSIEPIQKNRNTMVGRKERLKELVEPPLLSACEDLYDKNIRTLSTSANKKDVSVSGWGFIVIEMDSMSDENKQIAVGMEEEGLGEIMEYDRREALIAKIPLDETATIESVESQANDVAARFKHQPMTWAPKFSIEKLIEYYGVPPDADYAYDIDTWREEGYYYDEGSETFYLSEEHFKKVNETSNLINKLY